MEDLRDRVAVVTGASSGIGKSIALTLAAEGCHLCLVGRDAQRLRQVAEQAGTSGAQARVFQADLKVIEQIIQLRENIERHYDGLDVLAHCAGVISFGDLETAELSELDNQFAVNMRAPYALTQALLPLIKKCQGQVVIINSTVALNSPRAIVGQYAASKYALRAFADSLRNEVNPHGVRVLSVYPGRTATPMQEEIHEMEGRTYSPRNLLQSDDVASIVVSALRMPRTAEVTDITIRAMKKTA